MAQSDLLKRYLDVGMAFTELTRARAERIVKDLVRTGEVQRERAQENVDELLERSRKNTQAVADLVRRELKTQVTRLGLATKDDVSRLERKVDALASRSGASAAPRQAAAKKSTATKAAAPKTT
jgi:polyhydroxyalkanoate synthesis regulator phasin